MVEDLIDIGQVGAVELLSVLRALVGCRARHLIGSAKASSIDQECPIHLSSNGCYTRFKVVDSCAAVVGMDSCMVIILSGNKLTDSL